MYSNNFRTKLLAVFLIAGVSIQSFADIELDDEEAALLVAAADARDRAAEEISDWTNWATYTGAISAGVVLFASAVGLRYKWRKSPASSRGRAPEADTPSSPARGDLSSVQNPVDESSDRAKATQGKGSPSRRKNAGSPARRSRK